MNIKIVCPTCHDSINWINEKLDTCNNANCTQYKQEIVSIEGKYILVDFSRSVIDKSILSGNGQSPVERHRFGLIGTIKGIVSYTNPISFKNFSFLKKELLESDRNKVLIIGGGELGSGINDLVSTFSPVVIDVYLSQNVDFLADAHSLPFSDSQFDLVIIQAVLEHVVEPVEVVKEIHRVLKSDGIVYAETPFMQQIHEAAYDFQRFSKSGHRFLFRNFDEVNAGVLLGLYVSFAWNVSFFVRGITRTHLWGKLALRFLLVFRFIDKLIPGKWHSLGASAFYFIGRKSQSQMSHSDLIKYYQDDSISS
uniref:methyltransferase domain-containing protein n=1 Tax=Algoriphagus sp. TaxID=1872435 RepID=UPI004047ADCB